MITNIYEWFIFDAVLFDRIFAQNKTFVKQFNDFENGRLANITTDFFYKQIAEPFIGAIQQEIEFAYFDIRNYQTPIREVSPFGKVTPLSDKKLIALFKLLSPEHLLKLPFINDSNSLDKKFYSEFKDKSNDELLKMVYQFDQWSPEMLEAIKHELAKRGILPTDINAKKHQLAEIEEARLEKGKEASLSGQVVGWLTVFGLLGIFIGYHYRFSKVRSKYTGKQYFRYDESSLKNGTYLFYISICLSVIAIFYKIMTTYG